MNKMKMKMAYLISTSIGINLFGELISYISSIVFKNMIQDKIKEKSRLFASTVSFIFGVIITSIIIGSGLGQWKNDKIKDISCIVENSIENCKKLISRENN